MTSTISNQSTEHLGAELFRIYEQYDPPAYVKAASSERLLGSDALENHVFADTLKRQFPCHTKAATWLSAVQLWETGSRLRAADFQRIERRLLKTAKFFGIGKDVDDVRSAVTKQAQTVQRELADDDFAMVWKDTDGRVQRNLPLTHAAEVKAAAAWFSHQRDEFVFEDRQRIAHKIMLKASAYAAELTEAEQIMLEQAAGMGVCAAEKAAAVLDQRAAIARVKHPDLAVELLKTAELIRLNKTASRTPASLCKLAKVVDQVDRQLGLVQSYGDTVQRPEDVLFAITEKVANVTLRDHVVLTSGSAYHKSALSGMRIRDIQDYMGTDLAEAMTDDGIFLDVEKAAAVLPTLPRPDAELFDQIASEHKIMPAVKEAAAQRVGLTREDVFALALAAK